MAGLYNPFAGRASSYGTTKLGAPNLFGQYLSSGNFDSEQHDLYGYGSYGETPAIRQGIYDRFYNTMQPGGGSARARFLQNQQGQIDHGFSQYNADAGGEGHTADYLGSVDVERMWREADPFSAGRQNQYFRTRTAA